MVKEKTHYQISLEQDTKTKEVSHDALKVVGIEFFKNKFNEIQNDKLLSYGGIYLLIRDIYTQNKKYSIYIGFARDLQKRLKQHISGKIDWNKAIIFTKDDNKLDSAELSYLESKLFEYFSELEKFELLNKQEPIEDFKDYRKQDNCNIYLRTIEEILHLFNLIEPADYEDTESEIIQEEKIVEIKLGSSKIGKTPRWKRYNLIPLNSEIRMLFPKYKEEFIMETDVGNITTYVTSRSGESDFDPKTEGKYITTGLYKWFREHKDLEPGDFLIIEELIPKKRYKLSFRKFE